MFTNYVVNKAATYKRTNNDGSINYDVVLLGSILNKKDPLKETRLKSLIELGFEKKYAAKNHDLNIPARYVDEDGYNLGLWIQLKRRQYKKGTLTREQVYGAELEAELYETLEPYEGAVEYVKKLIDDGHAVYIVTTSPYQVAEMKIGKVILKLFPYISWKNVILTSNKQMIKGDVLIDDGIHNLLGGDYKKILMTAPYNKDFNAEENGMLRVSNWKEIYEAICKMDK